MFWHGRVSDLLNLIFFIQCGTLAQRCVPSVTLVRGQQVCSGQVIFEDSFDTRLDTNKWKHTVRISGTEEEEFVIYDKGSENSYTRGGILYIKPQLIDESIVDGGKIELEGCTGLEGSTECFHQSRYAFIMPPIKSAELKSLPFTFRYGKVEVKAKMPFGDWIVPHIYIKSQSEKLSTQNATARVTVVKSHGNNDLYQGTKDIGRKRATQFVSASYTIGSSLLKRFFSGNASVHWVGSQGWNEDFHTYYLEWTPDHLIFGLDDQPKHSFRIMKDANRMFGDEGKDGSSLDSPASIPPFEQEFHVAMSVYVGGYKEFADDVQNNGKSKPWSNERVTKARFHFWKDRSEWYPTWDDETSALQVDYIKITAL